MATGRHRLGIPPRDRAETKARRDPSHFPSRDTKILARPPRPGPGHDKRTWPNTPPRCSGSQAVNKRPLGLPTWSDKLVAEVVRLLLEAYYEPQFSGRSHGFRPGRRRQTRDYKPGRQAWAGGRGPGARGEVRSVGRRRRQIPSQDPADPGYRRLRYVRYADDWLLGFAGPRHEAEEIKARIAAFLRDELKLELSPSKTLITHATSQAARFLGYEIRAQHSDTKITRNRRAVNGAIGLFLPRDRIRPSCALYMSGGNPAQRGALLHDDDFTIIAKYQSEYAGRVQYYLLAQDVFRLGRLHWVMETSLLKTLAGKHRSTVGKMARKHKAVIATPAGPRKCLQLVIDRDRGRNPLGARVGGIPLPRARTSTAPNQRPRMPHA